MDEIKRAIKYFEDAIKESDEIIEECAGVLKAELTTQKRHFITALKAMGKQVPKKPISQSTWKACPACTQGIGVDNNTPNPKAIEYCFHCGQKLDWE